MLLDEHRLATDQLPPGIWEVTLLTGPGRPLLLPPRSFVKGRLAAGFAIGADEADCQHALDSLGAMLQVRGRRLMDG